jgi:hypothetical protein
LPRPERPHDRRLTKLKSFCLGPHHLDEPADPSTAFDEDGLFSFTTVEEMILAVSGYAHFLAGEASMIRLALGKPAASDPFDDLFNGTD